MRAALAVVALLLAPAAAAGVVPDPGIQPAATNASAGEDAPINRIAHLTAGGDATERLATRSVDVTSAVAIARDDAGARLSDYALEERLNRTNGTNAVLDGALDGIEARVRVLEADARFVRTRYANGSITATRFVRESARLQARAERLGARLSRLEEMAESYGNATHRARAERLDERLLGHTGPVRRRALGAVEGRRGSIDLYAAGSEVGVVFAAIEGSRHVRGAYRADRRTRASLGINGSEAIERFVDLYPVAFDLPPASYSLRGVNFETRVYRFRKTLSFGPRESLVSFLDGGTLEVFHEVQRRNLGELDQPASAAATANGTRLVVNRSYAGGPLRIATRDAGDGTPTASTVRVGSRRLETGDDGVVWTLMPPGPAVEVTAATPSGNVTVTVEPIALTPVNASGS